MVLTLLFLAWMALLHELGRKGGSGPTTPARALGLSDCVAAMQRCYFSVSCTSLGKASRRFLGRSRLRTMPLLPDCPGTNHLSIPLASTAVIAAGACSSALCFSLTCWSDASLSKPARSPPRFCLTRRAIPTGGRLRSIGSSGQVCSSTAPHRQTHACRHSC